MKTEINAGILSLKRIPRIALLLWLISTAFALCFFGQPDLAHTVYSSYGYLQGHFSDFYDFNAPIFGRNDYYPVLYLIFAIWMCPIYLMGLSTRANYPSTLEMNLVENAWAKIGLLIAVMIATFLLARLSQRMFKDNKTSQTLVVGTFFLSPLVGFAAFQFGQYDILGVIFTILGVTALIDRRSIAFVVWFSLAVSFKYFALFIFIPLALYYFRPRWKVLVAIPGAIAITALQILFYWNNLAFHRTVLNYAEDKGSDTLTNPIKILAALMYAFLCALAFFYAKEKGNQPKEIVLIWTSSLALMFTAVVWHPQWWIIYAAPIALCIGFMKRPGWFIWWIVVAFGAYVAYVSMNWPDNVDATMITRGPLSFLLQDPTLLQIDILPRSFRVLSTWTLTLFLFSPIFWIAFERFSWLQSRSSRFPSALTWASYSGSLLVFSLIPSLLLTFITPSQALAIEPSAISRISKVSETDCGASEAFIPKNAEPLVQGATSKFKTLKALSLRSATYNRINNGFIHISVTTDGGHQIASATINMNQLREDEDLFVLIEQPGIKAGQPFLVTVRENYASSLDASGLWGCSQAPKQETELKGIRPDSVGQLMLKQFGN